MDAKAYINALFEKKGISVPARHLPLLEEYAADPENILLVQTIIDNQNLLMTNYSLKTRIADVLEQQIVIPNATIGKKYEALIDFARLNLTDLLFCQFEDLAEIGLAYDAGSRTISGIPTVSGDLKFRFIFKLFGESEHTPPHEKLISIIINPDPKKLWKDLPSDKLDPFWKEDDHSVAASLGDRKVVVSSRRGRSHKNVGSFREDDFAFRHFDDTGWSVLAVSDGAGSYSMSRMGSKLACNAVISYFEEKNDADKAELLETRLAEYNQLKDESLFKEIEVLAKQLLYKATVHVHNHIKAHAEKTSAEHPGIFTNPKAKTPLDYYHATLIFTLFKKYEFGYVVLSFGVGDCPIAIVNKDKTQTALLNWLDVGEFGGGTRFITQPDIFHSTERPMASRFNVKIVPDFSFLFLMTDGIYDPKFLVEANLEKQEMWTAFLNDLGGANDDQAAVDFDPENKTIAEQLSAWMDFWSPGNHDDRTLAIVY